LLGFGKIEEGIISTKIHKYSKLVRLQVISKYSSASTYIHRKSSSQADGSVEPFSWSVSIRYLSIIKPTWYSLSKLSITFLWVKPKLSTNVYYICWLVCSLLMLGMNQKVKVLMLQIAYLNWSRLNLFTCRPHI